MEPTARDRARRLRRDSTDAERKLWSRLRAKRLAGAKFNRQYPVGPFIVDFFCLAHRLVIEVDGGQHAEREGQDRGRTAYLQECGYRVLRFWNNEVLTNIEGVVRTILEAIEGTSQARASEP